MVMLRLMFDVDVDALEVVDGGAEVAAAPHLGLALVGAGLSVSSLDLPPSASPSSSSSSSSPPSHAIVLTTYPPPPKHSKTMAPVTPTTLRELQAPIKAQYKADPSSAIVTLRSSVGTLDGSSAITCRLDSPNTDAIRAAHKAAEKERVAGLHPMAGGPEAALSGELCSGDMLLDALVACAGVTLKAVATALEIPVAKGTVRAEGDLDFRGTLGVDREAAVGFKAIRLLFDLQMEKGVEVGEEKLEKLAKLTERYCVVLQTIKGTPVVKVRCDGMEEPEPGLQRTSTYLG